MSTTDRELLELAAKAAGYEISFADGPDNDPLKAADDAAFWYCWNPLTDDGDALRLAVKLRIAVDFNFAGKVFAGYNGVNESGRRNHSANELCEPLEPDESASTRRAIVRAAAEIGKKSMDDTMGGKA